MADLTQPAIWNDLVGAAWVRHAGAHDAQAGPFGDLVMDALGTVAGSTVLDIGCGTGATCAALADRGAAAVLGVDLSAPMIDAARAANARTEVQFECADVLLLDGRQPFDVLFSRFAVMFFDEPVPAFAHLRVLGAPEARLGFCSWASPFDNPWMSVPVMATVPVLGPPALAGPGEPGPFSLSSPDVVRSVLHDAGWHDVETEDITLVQARPEGGAADVAAAMVEFNPLIAMALREAPELTDAACSAIAEALRPFEQDGVVHLQSSALVVTAHA